MNKIILMAMIFIACDSKKETCFLSSQQNLELWPVGATLKLPKYRIVDSTRWGKETKMSYNFKSEDSLLDGIVFVSSKVDSSNRPTKVEEQAMFQKKSVEYGRNVRKLNEQIRSINNEKIGFLKYDVSLKEKEFYEARIFFYRRGYFVEIWLFEKGTNINRDIRSQVDCIIESIEIH